MIPDTETLDFQGMPRSGCTGCPEVGAGTAGQRGGADQEADEEGRDIRSNCGL